MLFLIIVYGLFCSCVGYLTHSCQLRDEARKYGILNIDGIKFVRYWGDVNKGN